MAATASAPTSPSSPREHGATVEDVQPLDTDTHVERREDVVAACRRGAGRDRPGRLRGQHRRASCRGARWRRPPRRPIYAATEVNYIAPILIAQAFYPHLRETGGSLLLFTSSSYTRGRSGYSLYSSAKAATVNLTQALADEWASDGVRVNCINPERTATPMRTKAFGEEPAGSLLESETVARASLDTLLSELTGHVLDIRKADPFSSHALSARMAEDIHEAEPGDEMPEGATEVTAS